MQKEKATNICILNGLKSLGILEVKLCLGEYPPTVGSLFPQLQNLEDFIGSKNCLVKLIRHSCHLLSKHFKKLIKSSPFFPFSMCLEKNLLVGLVEGIKHTTSRCCSWGISFYKITASKHAAGHCPLLLHPCVNVLA